MGNDLWAALNDCDRAIEQQPGLAEAHNLRGLILDAMGKTDKAILAYREAVRLDPSLEDARVNLQDAENERITKPQGDVWQEAKPSLNWTKIIVGVAGVALLLALIAGAYFLFQLGWQYLGPKQTLVLETDRSLITSDVAAADLEEAAQILTERAGQLGYQRVVFIVNENGELIAKVSSQVDLKDFSSRISPIGLVEFVDFGNEPVVPGTRVATDLDHEFLQQGGGTRHHTLMTNSEIRDASVSMDAQGKPAVSFTFTENGANLLLAFTTQNVSKYLCIIQDKVVISCPVINVPITDGQGIIQGTFTEQQAADLAAVLKAKPLPIPIRIKQPAGSQSSETARLALYSIPQMP
jgi:hypothetical protein